MIGEFLNFRESLQNNVMRARKLFEKLSLIGIWRTEHYRKDAQGKLSLLDVYIIKNDFTTLGKNSLFDTMWNAATQVAAANWCAGLINNAAFTGYNPADAMSSHAGWTEWTSYSQTNRVAWGQGAASAASISNASPMVFNITANGTLRGLFLTTQNTKGGTTGLLWSAASYSSTVDVTTGDEIRSTYALSV